MPLLTMNTRTLRALRDAAIFMVFTPVLVWEILAGDARVHVVTGLLAMLSSSGYMRFDEAARKRDNGGTP